MSKKDKNRLNRHGLKRFDKHCPLWSAYVWPEGAMLKMFSLYVERALHATCKTQHTTQRRHAIHHAERLKA